MIITGTRLARLLAFGSMLTPIAAFAQAAVQDPPAVGEIVVTAQKRAQSINSVGMSITAASGEQLKALGITDVADMVKIVPGLTVQESQYNTPVYTLRGIGFYEASLAATPAVSVYVDEVALPYPAMTKLAAFDLERVEVLKGPQGTLYGQNSTGGAINFIAAKPSSTLQEGFDVSFGRFNTLDAQGYISGPLSPTLRARLAVRTVQSGDWQKSYTRQDSLGRTDQLQGRLLVDWTPIDRLTVAISATGWRDRSDTPAAQLIAITPQNAAAMPAAFLNYPLAPDNARAADWTPGEEFARNDRFYQFSGRIGYRLSDDITLTSITAYAKYTTYSTEGGSGTTYLDPNSQVSGAIETKSQELRLSGNSGPVNWLIGANYERDDIVDRFLLSVADGTNTKVFGLKFNFSDNRATTNATTYGIFSNLEYKLTDTITLQGGLRYNDDKRDFKGCTYDVDGGIAEIFTILADALSGHVISPLSQGACVTLGVNNLPGIAALKLYRDNLSWRTGINWKFADHSLLYANVSRGYKAGSFPTLAASTIVQFAPVVPESVLAYEAGVKSSLLDRKLQLNGAMFYYDYTDKQLRGKVPDPVFGTLEALVNIPKSRVYGAEVQAVLRPAAGLTINTSGTYVDTKIRQFTGINIAGESGNFAGTAFPYAPKWSFAGDVQYDFVISSRWNAFAGAGVTAQSRTIAALTLPNSPLTPLTALGGYALLDLRAGVRSADGVWSLMGWGRNVTNTFYRTNVVRGNDTVFGYAGRPVTYGLTLSYRFR